MYNDGNSDEPCGQHQALSGNVDTKACAYSSLRQARIQRLMSDPKLYRRLQKVIICAPEFHWPSLVPTAFS